MVRVSKGIAWHIPVQIRKNTEQVAHKNFTEFGAHKLYPEAFPPPVFMGRHILEGNQDGSAESRQLGRAGGGGGMSVAVAGPTIPCPPPGGWTTGDQKRT